MDATKTGDVTKTREDIWSYHQIHRSHFDGFD